MNISQKMANILFIFVTTMLVVSCNGTPVKLDQPASAISGQKYDMSKGRTARAQACGFQLFLFIPIVVNQRADIAYQSLKSQAGSGYLTDIRVQETWTYAFVGTLYCTIMEGTVYQPLQS
jgi:hypothetical protein